MKSKKTRISKQVISSAKMVKKVDKLDKIKGKAVKEIEAEPIKGPKKSKRNNKKEIEPVNLKGRLKKAEEVKPAKQKGKAIKIKDLVKISLRENLRGKLKSRRKRKPPVIPAEIMAEIEEKPGRKKRAAKEKNILPAGNIQSKVIINRKVPAGKPEVAAIIVAETGIENKAGKVKFKQLDTLHKPASIGWKYFLDKKGLPLMKIYTENPGVFFKLEKISDVKKSARYYTHKGDLIGADFIIPNAMIETACNAAGIKTPKNLIVLQSVEQQAVL
jgi:hypothetical protein